MALRRQELSQRGHARLQLRLHLPLRQSHYLKQRPLPATRATVPTTAWCEVPQQRGGDMNDQEKRIKLALLRGFYRQAFPVTMTDGSDGMSDFKVWHHPNHQRFEPAEQLPDPENDANDCNALITHLNGQGWQVEVHWQFTDDESLAPGAYIHIWNRYSEIHERTDVDRDNWMHGVCELALKVIENDRLLRAAQEPCPLA